MKVAIIGCGLIGGSFFKASQRAGHEAVILHHGDSTGFESAELILVCLPPDTIIPWIREHAGAFRAGALVVDIAGVKRTIMVASETLPSGDYTFVGGHPMAGREVSGYANSLATLFDGASMILVPRAETHPEALVRLKTYFASVGFARTVVTTPEKHDEMIAFTSQLCHVIATAYSRDELVRQTSGFSAGSYADMTRIATQDPAIWSELFLSNKDSLLAVVDRFVSRLDAFREALEQADRTRLMQIISEGAAAKRNELRERNQA